MPHPRLFERAFVLVPLAEIAPDRIIAGRRVTDALAQLSTEGIQRLPDLDCATQNNRLAWRPRAWQFPAKSRHDQGTMAG